ncbi:MAG: PsiF family protein, partial [Rhodanobacter sp.]
MTTFLRLLVAGAALSFAGATLAATPQTRAPATAPTPSSNAHTAQQQRMIDCNKQAAGKKGAEHKTFMSTCLKGGVAAAPPAKSTQQEKMKTCNAEATTKALKGAEHKTFMSNC